MIKYLEILFRLWPRFVALGLLLPAGISGGLAYLMPQYTSGAAIWVDDPAILGLPSSTTGWNQFVTPADNTLDGLQQLISTQSFVEQLGKSLDGSHAWASADERQSVLTSVRTDLTMKSSGSHLIAFTYTCHRQALCPAVLNATIDIYRTWLNDNLSNQTQAATQFYTSQLSEAQTTLSLDQQQLAEYAHSHPGASANLDPQYETLDHNVTDASGEVTTLKDKLDSLKLTSLAVGHIADTVLKVVDQPAWPSGGRLSSLPKKQIAIAWGACLGVVLAYVLVLGWLDRTARDPRDLERRLGVPVVATIPRLAAQERLQ